MSILKNQEKLLSFSNTSLHQLCLRILSSFYKNLFQISMLFPDGVVKLWCYCRTIIFCSHRLSLMPLINIILLKYTTLQELNNCGFFGFVFFFLIYLYHRHWYITLRKHQFLKPVFSFPSRDIAISSGELLCR